MKRTLSLLSAAVLMISCGPKALIPAEEGAFQTRKYRNVFVEAGYSSAEVDAKVNQVFEEVFFGPDKVYFEVEDSLAYVSDIKNNDVRTEGMSYGMMIAVQMDRKDMFDKLFRWCKKYMQHQDGPLEGYFAWSCKVDGTRNAQGPASDGELYYVTALLFASNRWGDDTGIDYKAEAQHILDCAFAKNGSNGYNNFINTEHKLITFTPDNWGYTYTDPSYHIPVFYEIWAEWADDGRADFWKECAAASREYLHKAIHPETGLNPDMSNYDGTIRYYNGNHFGSGNFRYDSWRVPMNIAMDYSLACVDKEWQKDYGTRIQNFFYGQGIDAYVDQYRVDGNLPSEDEILAAGSWTKVLRHSVGLVSTLAAASLLTGHEINREFVDALWNSQNVPYEDGYFDAYYDGLLRLFAFMHLSGKYQIIFPPEPADLVDKYPALAPYFSTPKAEAMQPDDQGFIRRWLLLEPISRPNRGNTVFVDSYVRKYLDTGWNKGSFKLPKDGEKVTVEVDAVKAKLTWHALDSKLFNVKLYRYAVGTETGRYGIICRAVTVIDVPEDIENVRLAVGSNSASMWWIDGEEALILSGDRRMVMDDAASKRLTLKKGRHILTGAVINGPGMSDFCVRFIDEEGNPVLNYNILNK